MKTNHYALERECIHHVDGKDGDAYNGAFYIQALQRLSGKAALQISKKVAPFFWADAAKTCVWLCKECAAELRLTDSPRAVVQASAGRR